MNGKKSGRRKDLETLAAPAVALLVFYALFRVKFLLLAASALLLAGLSGKTSARLASAWLAFAEALGAFNTKVLLFLVYFLFLTPLALIFRFFNKDPLDMSPSRAGDTAFRAREHSFTPADFEKPW